MSTLVTTNLKHGGAASPNIVLNSDGTFNIGDSKVVTPTGSAPSYTCRAWVNFNGTGTVAIRASGNVSSITDNGTGDYTVNFTTAMPDANYAPNINASGIAGYNGTPTIFTIPNLTEVAPTTSAFRFSLPIWNNTAGAVDQKYVAVSVFR